MTNLFSNLKQIDLRTLLRARGVTIDPANRTFAPWREERTPSVVVYKDHWHDYGDPDKHGDFLDWLELAEGQSREAARDEAARIIGSDTSCGASPNPKPASQPRPSADKRTPQTKCNVLPASWIAELVNQSHDALMRRASPEAKQAWTHLERRGLVGVAADLRFGVVDASVKVPEAGRKLQGLQGRLVFPTLLEGKPVWFKARYVGPLSDDEAKEQKIAKYDGPSGSVPAPYNADVLTDETPPSMLVLTEGEPDAISVLVAYDDLTTPVVGLPGGTIPADWLERFVHDGTLVYLIMDNDDAGRRHAERIRAALEGRGAKVFLVNIKPYNDVNEALQALGPDGLRQHLEAAFESVTHEALSDLLYIRETFPDLLDHRAARTQPYYTTGLDPLDKLLGGGYLEGLHLMGGITGGGKTSFALHLAIRNALAGKPVIYGSYEQPRFELWSRIAAQLTKVPYTAIKRGSYDDKGLTVRVSSQLKNDAGWDKLVQVAKHLKVFEGGDAFSREQGTYTLEVLAQSVARIADECGAPPLVIIDYLQRVPVPAELRAKDTRERVSHVAGILQIKLGRDLGCPVLALSSIGRAAYKLQESDLEGRLAAFKEAGELEYTAYTALLLYGLSDKWQAELNLAPGLMSKFRPMTLDLAKNREGEIGQLAVQWTPAKGVWEGARELRGLVHR